MRKACFTADDRRQFMIDDPLSQRLHAGGTDGQNDTLFRAHYNQTRTSRAKLTTDISVSSEVKLAADLNVSRTVVRAVLLRLRTSAIFRLEGYEKPIRRRPRP